MGLGGCGSESSSRVLPGEGSIDIADVGTVEVGARALGGGGLIDGPEEVEHFAQARGLDDEVTTCQADIEDPSLTGLNPSGP